MLLLGRLLVAGLLIYAGHSQVRKEGRDCCGQGNTSLCSGGHAQHRWMQVQAAGAG